MLMSLSYNKTWALVMCGISNVFNVEDLTFYTKHYVNEYEAHAVVVRLSPTSNVKEEI